MQNVPAMFPFTPSLVRVKGWCWEPKAEVSDDRFTDVCAACAKPTDAEVRAAAVEDIHPGHVIYNSHRFLA